MCFVQHVKKGIQLKRSKSSKRKKPIPTLLQHHDKADDNKYSTYYHLKVNETHKKNAVSISFKELHLGTVSIVYEMTVDTANI